MGFFDFFLRLSSGNLIQDHKSDVPCCSLKGSLSRPFPGTRLKRGLCPDSKRGQSIFTLAICNIFMLCRGTLARKPGTQIIIVLLYLYCTTQLFSPAQPSSCLGRFPQSTIYLFIPHSGH